MSTLGTNAAILLSFCVLTTTYAETAPEKLLSEQGPTLKGMTPELVYTGAFWSGMSGVYDGEASYVGNLDLALTLSGDELYGVPGNKIYLYLLNNHGGKPNNIIGSGQGIDSTEVTTNTTKFLEAWMEQEFFEGKFALLAGLYDVNSEFDVSDSAGLYTNPSFGIGPEFSATGQNGPSIFPTTSLALRAKIAPWKNFYFQGAILDGVPGSITNPYGTHIQFNTGDGSLLLAELGLESFKITENVLAKIGIGHWEYTSRFDDLVDLDDNGLPIKRKSSGNYLLMDYNFVRGENKWPTALDAFLKLGVSDKDINQFKNSLQIGLNLHGLLPKREEDIFGFGLTSARPSEKWNLANAGADFSQERIMEATYSAKMSEWLTIQPDMQWIRTYNSAAGTPNTTVAGLRFQITV